MLTVITGPPCSGKSTEARKRAQPGDIVIDYDLIAQALGSPTPYDPPDPIRWVAIAARRAAVNAAIAQHHQGATVWIVHTRIPAADLQRYRQAGAHIVTLTADPATLHARADAERPTRWHKLIDEWRPEADPRPARSAAPRDNRRSTRPYKRWRRAVLARSTVCWICGHGGADSADHITPLALGGALLDPDNGAPAHHEPCPTCGRRCNAARGTLPGRGEDTHSDPRSGRAGQAPPSVTHLKPAPITSVAW